jgi:hypothetical protein
MAPGILVSDDLTMDDAPSSSPNEDNSDSPPAFSVGDVPGDGSDKENRKTALEDMFDDDDDDEFMSSLAETVEGQQFVARVFSQRR